MGVTDDRRRMIAAQPHLATASGGLVQVNTDMTAPASVTGSGNITLCGKNLFDKNAVSVGDNLGSDGSISYSANSRLSGYIPVNGQVVFSAQKIGTAGIRLGLYDADKQWIERKVQTSATDGYTTIIINNSNVKFVRADIFVTSEDIDTAMLEIGTARTTFEAYSGATVAVADAGSLRTHPGVNTFWSDAGDVSITYWTH